MAVLSSRPSLNGASAALEVPIGTSTSSLSAHPASHHALFPVPVRNCNLRRPSKPADIIVSFL